ncbi:MAG: DoxX family protein [Lutibacter sp.]|nr:MAG: DoxX family protein [Lutibacter sp.]
MKILIYISRLFVAITFIFSGFVKLVDPLGSSYKFQEYFSVDVLNLEFLIPYSLPFSIFLILAEIILGVMLLVGYLPKLTVWSLLGMMLFFLFLTWYSAYYDKVTDCGCFGDAVKLTPWETFYKNVILIIFIVALLVKVEMIKPLFGLNSAKWISFFSFIGFLSIIYYVLIHLPIIDFRPYAVGKNIPMGMEYINNEEPPIHDFFLESVEGLDLTEKVLTTEEVLLVVIYNIEKSDMQGFSKIKTITDNAISKGYLVYALSSSLNEEYAAIKNKFNLNFEVLFCDEVTLKTIIRANPGIVTLNKGTVTGKYNWIDAEDVKF